MYSSKSVTRYLPKWLKSRTVAIQVFLQDGSIRLPLVPGIAFDFVDDEQWNSPKCVPGLISPYEDKLILHYDDVYIWLPQLGSTSIREHMTVRPVTDQLIIRVLSERGLSNVMFVGAILEIVAQLAQKLTQDLAS